MSKIETLLEDIYALKSHGIPADQVDMHDELFEEFGQTMADALKQSVTQRDPNKIGIWFSNLGDPTCKAWYRMKKYPRPPLEPWVTLKFFFGDWLEKQYPVPSSLRQKASLLLPQGQGRALSTYDID